MVDALVIHLRAAGQACGVGGLTPHSLRHSLATHLAGWWGLSDRQVMMVLRHAPQTKAFRPVATERYLHPDLVNLVGMVKGFDFTGATGRAGCSASSPAS